MLHNTACWTESGLRKSMIFSDCLKQGQMWPQILYTQDHDECGHNKQLLLTHRQTENHTTLSTGLTRQQTNRFRNACRGFEPCTFSLNTTLTVATRNRGCHDARWSGLSASEAISATHNTSMLQVQYLTPYWKIRDLSSKYFVCYREICASGIVHAKIM